MYSLHPRSAMTPRCLPPILCYCSLLLIVLFCLSPFLPVSAQLTWSGPYLNVNQYTYGEVVAAVYNVKSVPTLFTAFRLFATASQQYIVWQNSTNGTNFGKATQMGSTVLTTNDPTLVVFNNQLYCFFITTSNYMAYTTFVPASLDWTSPTTLAIPNVAGYMAAVSYTAPSSPEVVMLVWAHSVNSRGWFAVLQVVNNTVTIETGPEQMENGDTKFTWYSLPAIFYVSNPTPTIYILENDAYNEYLVTTVIAYPNNYVWNYEVNSPTSSCGKDIDNYSGFFAVPFSTSGLSGVGNGCSDFILLTHYRLGTMLYDVYIPSLGLNALLGDFTVQNATGIVEAYSVPRAVIFNQQLLVLYLDASNFVNYLTATV